ncbi:hypothetical protein [Olivibacter domesticus]|uniref:CDP-Glycerol:Poly(Glycerophosphate) glycerophosphotransferase n=1 Tax=Olivibacter domesticus TaxID=407022 RepID=A0A1H7UWZ1_OLID1|nr:hypothetical protein [Olivibacter domesticus]SEM01453.1 hypothetical protein SAMN05661044_03984 [Olivibacter domesticus]
MKRKDVIDFISTMEIKYPVNEWKIGDIDLWPIIKMDIFFRWYKSQTKPDIQRKRRNIIKKAFDILKSFRSVFAFVLKQPITINNVYCGSASHRIEHDGVFINRFFLPLINTSKNRDHLEIEYGARDFTKNYSNSNEILFVQDFYDFFYLIKSFHGKDKMHIPSYDSFLEDVQANVIKLPDNYKNIIYSKYNSVLIYSRIFKMILKKHKPANVTGLCYYDNAMFGMHYAANAMGISNIDMQHGGQGPLHPMYNFSTLPKKGFFGNVPQKFWCWDQASTNLIEKWALKSNFISVINGGNPWIDYAVNKYSKDGTYYFPRETRIILVTLQERELQNNIIDAIQLSSTEYQWWIRLHPRMMEGKEGIRKQLEGLNISNFEIEKATDYPLPVILRNCFLHISKYSGSIIEAGLLGVKSLIVDPIGIETFSHYLETGDAIDACDKTGAELVGIIKSIA